MLWILCQHNTNVNLNFRCIYEWTANYQMNEWMNVCLNKCIGKRVRVEVSEKASKEANEKLPKWMGGVNVHHKHRRQDMRINLTVNALLYFTYIQQIYIFVYVYAMRCFLKNVYCVVFTFNTPRDNVHKNNEKKSNKLLSSKRMKQTE